MTLEWMYRGAKDMEVVLNIDCIKIVKEEGSVFTSSNKITIGASSGKEQINIS